MANLHSSGRKPVARGNPVKHPTLAGQAAGAWALGIVVHFPHGTATLHLLTMPGVDPLTKDE
jgi:hypothetical protein